MFGGWVRPNSQVAKDLETLMKEDFNLNWVVVNSFVT